MAIDFASMMLKPGPTQPWDLGPPAGQQSMERERLRLMREQFEETKRQNEESNRLEQMRIDGSMAREQLGLQKQREQAAAEAAAVQQKQRMEAQQKFAELNAKGDIGAARAMIPQMTALGMGVELEGEEGGMPRYRIDMDAAEADRQESARAAQTSSYGPNETAEQSLSRLNAMGPGDETGSLEAPAGIQSSDEVGPEGLTVAERVASTYGEPYEKTPMAGPAEPDYTGGIPSNVLDMGAIQSQTAARLNPALSGLIAGLPPQYQASARSTAEGISHLGLPAAESVKMYGEQQNNANALIKSQLEAEDKQAAANYAQRFKTDEEGYKRYNDALNTTGPKTIAGPYDLDNRKKQRVLNARFKEILSNPIGADDLLVLGGIVRGLGEVGAQSNADAARAVGLPATSTWDQIADWITSRTQGGMPETAKHALLNVVKKNIEANDGQLKEFGEKIQEMINDPETDPDVARGLRQYYKIAMPADMRKELGPKAAAAPNGAATESAGKDELGYLIDAEAGISGLDPKAIAGIIKLESGGNPGARNAQSGATGLIQFMPETAKAMGTTTEELAKMPVEDQVRFVVKYFENAGITADSPPGDYAVAVAAPAFVGKPDETVVYEKGSKAWEQNKPWRPEDGGDITVGSIKAAYAKKGGEGTSKPLSEMTDDELSAREAELMKRLGQ